MGGSFRRNQTTFKMLRLWLFAGIALVFPRICFAFPEFPIYAKNRLLEGALIEQTEGQLTAIRCITRCLIQGVCKSVNYKIEGRICMLNKETSSDGRTGLKESKGFAFYGKVGPCHYEHPKLQTFIDSRIEGDEYGHGVFVQRWHITEPGCEGNMVGIEEELADPPAEEHTRQMLSSSITKMSIIRIRTLLQAPMTGNYTFSIVGDNCYGLVLHETWCPTSPILLHMRTPDPSKYTRLNDWNKYPEHQTSPTPVFLRQGDVYLLTGLSAARGGSTGLGIAYERPDGIFVAFLQNGNLFYKKSWRRLAHDANP